MIGQAVGKEGTTDVVDAKKDVCLQFARFIVTKQNIVTGCFGYSVTAFGFEPIHASKGRQIGFQLGKKTGIYSLL